MQEDYRRDDRSRREEEERYEDDRRRARDAGRDLEDWALATYQQIKLEVLPAYHARYPMISCALGWFGVVSEHGDMMSMAKDLHHLNYP